LKLAAGVQQRLRGKAAQWADAPMPSPTVTDRLSRDLRLMLGERLVAAFDPNKCDPDRCDLVEISVKINL
jgi:hypothetical protein